MKTALSCGGNLGDVVSSIHQAGTLLCRHGMKSLQFSSFYVTSPVECLPGTPDFINSVITGDWPYSVNSLLKLCKNIEADAGRDPNHPRNSDRPLDLDIVIFGNKEIRSEHLTIPHPLAASRLFVLIPLAEIAGDWLFPGENTTVTKILDRFKTSAEYQKIIQHKLPENS